MCTYEYLHGTVADSTGINGPIHSVFPEGGDALMHLDFN